MRTLTQFLDRHLVPPLTALSNNPYLSAIRAGMVAIVPLTIIGGLFLVISEMPWPAWQSWVTPYKGLLEVPVAATFGLLAVFVCFAIAYDLAKHLKLEAHVSASMATLIFLMVQLQRGEAIDGELGALVLNMDGLASGGLFTAILVALVSVRVQKALNDYNLVIKLPKSVPEVVYESFLSLVPMLCLMVGFFVLRFVMDVDINQTLQTVFSPLLVALNTLPGILIFTFLLTMLWSIGINGDNTLDAVVAPIFLMFLAANVEAAQADEPLPYITALGFITSFVNVGGTGATIALALVMVNSKDAGYRQISRVSLPTQIFQINEPIFFGFPIVLNPVFMIPYIFSAMSLTTITYLLMDFGMISKPVIHVPWTTPPVIGHFLVSGGDWRAALWGAVSIPMCMAIYYPFAKTAERQRLKTLEHQKTPVDNGKPMK
ncbi:MAG: PTS sugar transporter subunit IIC [Verrucomicrobia bacterium]|nr:PTS sugar transporter subunit IIC [Verrucomicrobiota bacterium]MBT6805588.1 PTS sugar transporter subunit IIC [Verrucomicrobiota bacterium]